MARIFKMTVELHPPNGIRPNYCVESYEKVRLAGENRVLHFGIKDPMTPDDVEWIRDCIGAQIEALLVRTLGLQLEIE